MIAADSSPTQGATLDVERPGFDPVAADTLMKLRDVNGGSLFALVSTFAKLAAGRGRIAFPDFVRLRLFDPSFAPGADPTAFVGQRRNRDIAVSANWRHDWYGMMSNKVAQLSYLATFGLPIIPIRAIYAPGFGHGALTLADRDALVRFLSAPENYPLFGKPSEGLQSLGSVGLRSVDAATGILTKASGATVAIDQLAGEIEANYSAGYIFQSMVRPEKTIEDLCGPKLACVRLITALTESGPQVLRGCWKIPAGGNIADNYWRPGNLLAGVDMASGKITGVTSGVGLDLKTYAKHPDTDVDMVGFQHPEWEAMTALALEGAGLMQHMPLIGWDIACSAQGPLIVEMNEAPDFFLVQLADRKGMLDPSFEAFLAFQAKKQKAYVAEAQARLAKL